MFGADVIFWIAYEDCWVAAGPVAAPPSPPLHHAAYPWRPLQHKVSLPRSVPVVLLMQLDLSIDKGVAEGILPIHSIA